MPVPTGKGRPEFTGATVLWLRPHSSMTPWKLNTQGFRPLGWEHESGNLSSGRSRINSRPPSLCSVAIVFCSRPWASCLSYRAQASGSANACGLFDITHSGRIGVGKIRFKLAGRGSRKPLATSTPTGDRSSAGFSWVFPVEHYGPPKRIFSELLIPGFLFTRNPSDSLLI